jgi:hypothetical protein
MPPRLVPTHEIDTNAACSNVNNLCGTHLPRRLLDTRMCVSLRAVL